MSNNKERNENIMALAAQKFSFRTIARLLGISRNAVAGVVYRSKRVTLRSLHG